MRRAILGRAWSMRPAPLKMAMQSAAGFEQKREELTEMSGEAESRFQLARSFPAGVPDEMDFSQKPPAVNPFSPDQPPGDWTPKEVHEAAASESGQAGQPDSVNWETQDADEIAKSAFEKVMPTDHLFEASPFLSMLKAHYPVFGEVLDAVSSSISEATFDAIRKSTVQAIITERRGRPDAQVDTLIAQRAAAATAGARIDFKQFDSAWAAQRHSEFVRYTAEISRAENSLEATAELKQRASMRSESEAVNAQIGVLDKAELVVSAAATGLPTRKMIANAQHAAELAGIPRNRQPAVAGVGAENALRLREVTSEIVSLGLRWPALNKPDKNLLNQLAAVSKGISHVAPSLPTTGLETQFHFGLPTIREDNPAASAIKKELEYLDTGPSDPFKALRQIKTYCDARLRQIVADSGTSDAQRAQLRITIGDAAYDAALQDWQAEQKKKIETTRLSERTDDLGLTHLHVRPEPPEIRPPEIEFHPMIP